MQDVCVNDGIAFILVAVYGYVVYNVYVSHRPTGTIERKPFLC